MELGGEFYLDSNALSVKQYSVSTYLEPESPLLFDSGRSAIRYAAQGLRDGVVLLPEYICDSVIRAFSDRSIRFYRLMPSLEIDIDDLTAKLDSSVSTVFLMHYFGAVQPVSVLEQLESTRQQYGFTILEDTTHSVFSARRTIGDLCVCSLRKWFALPGGGALYGPGLSALPKRPTLPRKTDNSRVYGMICKSLFLAGVLDCNQEYLDIFRETEDMLDAQQEVFQISDFSDFLLKTVDTKVLTAQRRRNYAYLKNALTQMGISPLCTLADNACPLVLPIWSTQRDALRYALMEHKIYCAVHWSFDGVQSVERPFARELSAHILSLPIDQRYDLPHMDHLVDALTRCKGMLL